MHVAVDFHTTRACRCAFLSEYMQVHNLTHVKKEAQHDHKLDIAYTAGPTANSEPKELTSAARKGA